MTKISFHGNNNCVSHKRSGDCARNKRSVDCGAQQSHDGGFALFHTLFVMVALCLLSVTVSGVTQARLKYVQAAEENFYTTLASENDEAERNFFNANLTGLELPSSQGAYHRYDK